LPDPKFSFAEIASGYALKLWRKQTPSGGIRKLCISTAYAMDRSVSALGTSRHFAASWNSVAVAGIADIDQTASDQASGSNLGQIKAITALAPKR
jgi:hypothetical protein